jgi:hypothetical protein
LRDEAGDGGNADRVEDGKERGFGRRKFESRLQRWRDGVCDHGRCCCVQYVRSCWRVGVVALWRRGIVGSAPWFMFKTGDFGSEVIFGSRLDILFNYMKFLFFSIHDYMKMCRLSLSAKGSNVLLHFSFSILQNKHERSLVLVEVV